MNIGDPELPVLYSFRRCPYAMRARLALRQAGVSVEIREILLRDKPAALRAASPKATVPVLLLPGGAVLEQSLDIMCWALQQADPEFWLLAAPWAEQQTLITLNDGPFKRLLDIYKYPQRQAAADGVSGTAIAAAARDAAVLQVLAPWDTALRRQAYLLGPRCSVADMAVLPFVRQFAAVDPAWFEAAPLPSLRAWLQQRVSEPLFISVMEKLPVWQSTSL
ncbi:glutathione S-transferase N-terminal domain-containing protein [Roseateles sp. GG27B]